MFKNVMFKNAQMLELNEINKFLYSFNSLIILFYQCNACCVKLSEMNVRCICTYTNSNEITDTFLLFPTRKNVQIAYP